MGGFHCELRLFYGGRKLIFIHSGKFVENGLDAACRDALPDDIGYGGNFHDRLHRADDDKNGKMRAVVFFVFRWREHAALDVVVDHGRREQAFPVDVKRTEILFRKSDNLIHVKLELWQLIPSRDMNAGNGGRGVEKPFFIHACLHGDECPAACILTDESRKFTSGT